MQNDISRLTCIHTEAEQIKDLKLLSFIHLGCRSTENGDAWEKNLGVF